MISNAKEQIIISFTNNMEDVFFFSNGKAENKKFINITKRKHLNWKLSHSLYPKSKNVVLLTDY